MPPEKKSPATSKPAAKRILKLPTIAEDRRILAGAKGDPDARPLTDAQLESMVPFKSLRGRPKLENPKVLVSIRYSSDVLTFFKDSGEGWQSRMNGVLRDYVRRKVARSRRGG